MHPPPLKVIHCLIIIVFPIAEICNFNLYSPTCKMCIIKCFALSCMQYINKRSSTYSLCWVYLMQGRNQDTSCSKVCVLAQTTILFFYFKLFELATSLPRPLPGGFVLKQLLILLFMNYVQYMCCKDEQTENGHATFIETSPMSMQCYNVLLKMRKIYFQLLVVVLVVQI